MESERAPVWIRVIVGSTRGVRVDTLYVKLTRAEHSKYRRIGTKPASGGEDLLPNEWIDRHDSNPLYEFGRHTTSQPQRFGERVNRACFGDEFGLFSPQIQAGTRLEKSVVTSRADGEVFGAASLLAIAGQPSTGNLVDSDIGELRVFDDISCVRCVPCHLRRQSEIESSTFRRPGCTNASVRAGRDLHIVKNRSREDSRRVAGSRRQHPTDDLRLAPGWILCCVVY